MKEIIAVKNGPKAGGPYSPIVKANGFFFLSGQIPLDPNTNQLVTGSIEDQTKRVLENLKAVLGNAGLSLNHIVKTTVFLKNMQDFQRMNEAYAEFFGGEPPARTTVEVARLPRDVQIEIEAIAAGPATGK